MEDRRQDAQQTPDDLNKLLNIVVFLDLDEMVRVANQAIQHGNDSTVVLNVFSRLSAEVGAQRNDRYKQKCSESPQANR